MLDQVVVLLGHGRTIISNRTLQTLRWPFRDRAMPFNEYALNLNYTVVELILLWLGLTY